MKTPKCKCIPDDTESFCMICCPEMFECLEEPHIKKYIEQELAVARYWAVYHACQQIGWTIADWRDTECMEDEVIVAEKLYDRLCSIKHKEKEQAEAIGGDCGEKLPCRPLS